MLLYHHQLTSAVALADNFLWDGIEVIGGISNIVKYQRIDRYRATALPCDFSPSFQKIKLLIQMLSTTYTLK